MDSFTIISDVVLAAFVSMGLTYSRQRWDSTYDVEETHKAATRTKRSGSDDAGTGRGGGSFRHA
jgi:hypothetical protein